MTTLSPHKCVLLVLLVFNLSLMKAQTEYIVTVNSATGIPTKIDSIPGVIWLVSNSTYNQTTKEYTVIGTHEQGIGPDYLYTLNAVTGKILWRPITSSRNIINMQYSRSTGILYGIIGLSGKYYLATIDKTIGAYSIISTITGIDALGDFVIDEARQRLYARGVDGNPNFALRTIDLTTGNTIYHVSTKNINELQYDNTSGKLYALASVPPANPAGNSVFSLCTVDPATGTVTNIADLNGVSGLHSSFGSFNENDHSFYFVGVEQFSTPYAILYSVDAINGNIINRAHVSSSGSIDRDNLIFFRYDNLSNILYGLLWEAKTIKAPVDSSCTLVLKTKVYPSPFKNILSIDKKPTVCSVTINLYNGLGQLALRGRKINDGHNEITLSAFSAGIYYYELISDGRVLLSGSILKQ